MHTDIRETRGTRGVRLVVQSTSELWQETGALIALLDPTGEPHRA